jgi:hypothetical protein
LLEGTVSESSRGHKRAIVAPRGRVVICSNTTVCPQVEGFLVTTALPGSPALVRLLAGIFSGGADVNLDDAIEELAG